MRNFGRNSLRTICRNSWTNFKMHSATNFWSISWENCRILRKLYEGIVEVVNGKGFSQKVPAEIIFSFANLGGVLMVSSNFNLIPFWKLWTRNLFYFFSYFIFIFFLFYFFLCFTLFYFIFCFLFFIFWRNWRRNTHEGPGIKGFLEKYLETFLEETPEK